MTEIPPHRSSDYITWRDIAELREWIIQFVADSEAKWHTVRAESLVIISNTLEKMDGRMDAHDTYHREILTEALQSMREARQNDTTRVTEATQFAQNYRLALWAVGISILGVIVSAVVAIAYHV